MNLCDPWHHQCNWGSWVLNCGLTKICYSLCWTMRNYERFCSYWCRANLVLQFPSITGHSCPLQPVMGCLNWSFEISWGCLLLRFTFSHAHSAAAFSKPCLCLLVCLFIHRYVETDSFLPNCISECAVLAGCPITLKKIIYNHLSQFAVCLGLNECCRSLCAEVARICHGSFGK